MSVLIHHETIEAEHADEHGGRFAVVENADGFLVIDSARGETMSDHGELDAAMGAAQAEADAYDLDMAA